MNGLVRELALVLGLTLVAGIATKAIHPRSPAWFLVVDLGEEGVTEDMVEERWGGDVMWVDARPEKVYEKKHREGAILLNEEQWNDLLYEQFDFLAAAGKPIVVYCDGARCARSKNVAKRLRELGMGEVYYLYGGWKRRR